MTLGDDQLVWAFDGRDGRDGGLRAMLGFYLEHLSALLPPPSDDPFEQIVADLADDPTNRMLADPRLARLYPPATNQERDADEFWRSSIHDQTRIRIASAEKVSAALEEWTGFVPVSLAEVDDWARTLGALRLFWYAELAGTERLAEPVAAVVRDNPGLHDLIEWLGYLLEDLLEMRAACLLAGHGLDPEQFERA